MPEVTLDGAGNLYGASGLNFSGLFKLSYNGAWFVTGSHEFERLCVRHLRNAGFRLPPATFTTTSRRVIQVDRCTNWAQRERDEIFNTVYSFSGDGIGPVSTLTMDSSGNLYGVTNQLGAHGFGNVFKLTHAGGAWSYTSLYDFTGGTDGANPWGQVILDSSGDIYGTTVSPAEPAGTAWCGGEVTP